MANVIKMDLYRMVKSFSFRFGLFLVFLLNFLNGPFDKIGYTISKKVAESSNDEELLKQLGDWVNDFHLGNVIADQLGFVCTTIFLIVVVKFCYADIKHGYIKNIAGQLPSRGHTIISKFIAIEAVTPLFFIVTIGGTVVGNLIIGREMHSDLFYAAAEDIPEKVFALSNSFGELAVKFVLLSGLSAIVLLLTTGLGSNIAGTIVAVLCGTGFTDLAYSGISAGINKLFNLEESKQVIIADYMPDGLYRSDLVYEGLMSKAVSIGIITVVVVLFITLKVYNKKDIK